MPLDSNTLEVLRALQLQIGEGNAERGFHDEGDELRDFYAATRSAVTTLFDESENTFADSSLRNYYTSRLALITTEVAEAIEELRHGRAIDETYYPDAPLGGNAIHETGAQAKPEGVPSEIADIVIRAFDFAHETGIDLAAMIAEKLSFNASRSHLHGKKF